MATLDRLVRLCASIMLVVVGVALVLGAFGWSPMQTLTALARAVESHRLEAGIAGLLVLLAGWHLLYHALTPKQDEGGIVRDTPLGQVRIQYRALENLVTRTAQTVEGIRDVEARIVPRDGDVAIAVALNVLPTYRIPALSDQVQSLVEETVRDMAGVDVASVTVEVKNVTGPGKAPKPARTRVE